MQCELQVGIVVPEVSHKKREPSQPYAPASTKYLAGLVLNKIVELKEYGQDRYGRTLGAVADKAEDGDSLL